MDSNDLKQPWRELSIFSTDKQAFPKGELILQGGSGGGLHAKGHKVIYYDTEQGAKDGDVKKQAEKEQEK